MSAFIKRQTIPPPIRYLFNLFFYEKERILFKKLFNFCYKLICFDLYCTALNLIVWSVQRLKGNLDQVRRLNVKFNLLHNFKYIKGR